MLFRSWTPNSSGTSASCSSTWPCDLRSVSPPTALSAVPAVKLAVAEKHMATSRGGGRVGLVAGSGAASMRPREPLAHPPGGRCRHYADPAADAGRGGARGAVRRQTRYAGRSEGDLEKGGERPVHEHAGGDGCTRRSEGRRVGEESGSTYRCEWSQTS